MKLIVVVGLLVSSLVASASASPSSSPSLSTTTTTRSGSTERLTIPVHSRSDLPTLPESCPGVRLFWNDALIKSLGTMADVLQSYHSGVTMELLPGGDAECAAATRHLTKGMTLEFVALYFPIGGVLPEVTAGQPPVWNNTANVRFSRNMISGFEMRNWTDTYEIGTMTAAAFNRWMDFPVSFAHDNPGYELFDVWSSSVDPANVWFKGSYCHSFSVEAMVQAYEMNGGGTSNASVDFSTSKHTLMYRNFQPVLTETNPQVVDLSDPAQLKEVNAFYGTFRALLTNRNIKNVATFVELLMEDLQNGLFYVYDSLQARYLKVSLVPPYVAIVGMYQPIRLPWQEFLQPACPAPEAPLAPETIDLGSSVSVTTGAPWEAVVALCAATFLAGILASVAVSKIRAAHLRKKQSYVLLDQDEFD